MTVTFKLETKKPTRLINIAILFGVTFSMLLVAEFVVRLTLKDSIDMSPRYHTDARYGDFTLRRLRPNSDFTHKTVDGSWQFVTNSQGFRSHWDYQYTKPENTIRGISLGDSHTQGYEVRQSFTFSAVAERYLIKAGLKSEVLNTGISGFSTAEQLIFLENEGIKFQPDFILVGFFRNDLEDNIKAGLFEINDDDELIIVKKQHVPGVRIQNVIYSIPGTHWLSENSYLYSFAFNTTWVYFKRKFTRNESERVMEYAVSMQSSFDDYQINLAAKIFERMYNFCKVNKIKLVIIDIPHRLAEGYAESSVPEKLLPSILRFSDAYIDGADLLSDYAFAVELHVPHGGRHISEFSHSMIGVEAAKTVISLLVDTSTD